MNSVDMETFWAVLEHGSMTAAANALFITQPTLSARVQALEDEVGAKLFVRGKGVRQVQLTESGLHFLPLARRWHTLLTQTQAFTSAEKQASLRIVASYTANRHILPLTYQRFLARELPVLLRVETLSTDDAVSALLQGRCDFAIVSSRWAYERQVDVTPLFRESFLLGTSGDNDAIGDEVHPSQLRVEDEILADQPEVLQWHNHWFGMDARPALHTDAVEAIPTCGRRWSIVPACSAVTYRSRYGWKICRLLEPPAERTFYLVRRRATDPSEVEVLFMEDMLTELRKIEDIRLLV